MNGGVHQHHAPDPIEVTLRPAERDRPSPIVCDGDDRPDHVDSIGEHAEIVDPCAEAAERPGSLGEAHVEMIDSDDADIGRSGSQQVTKQVGP